MDQQHFDSELRKYFNLIKDEIKKDHSEYVKIHPELREILNDFCSSVLLEKPNDVFDYAREFFSYFNIEKDRITYNPVVISGPRGAGKQSVIDSLIKESPDIFESSISYTTRMPRPGEIHGFHYYFVSKDEFKKEIKKDSFVERIERDGEFYGIHKGKLNAIIQKGKVALIAMDLDGAKQVIETQKGWNYLYIHLRNLKDLESRMKQRYDMQQEEVDKAMKQAYVDEENFKKMGVYTEIINDEIQTTLVVVKKFIREKYASLKW